MSMSNRDLCIVSTLCWFALQQTSLPEVRLLSMNFVSTDYSMQAAFLVIEAS